MLNELKKEANYTYTENGALTYQSSGSMCLDFFAAVGALRFAPETELIRRFVRAYTEDRDLALKALFFARDIRGGLGERRAFRAILRWLAIYDPQTVRKNLPFVSEYGRFDDLLSLMDTSCETDMVELIKEQLAQDLKALEEGKTVSLLGKWLPSVNASSPQTIDRAKRLARALGMPYAEYRKTLGRLRTAIAILENPLREKDYSFAYEKQPSKALLKYRKAFARNDRERYGAFLDRAAKDPKLLHTGTLTPYDIVGALLNGYAFRSLPEEELRSLDTTWNALEDYTGSDNALAVVDGSGSMYLGGRSLPAAVAQSLGIYFAERNRGAFHNHFITFGEVPKLVEIRGETIAEKLQYCMSYDDWSNTDLQAVFELLLRTAVKHQLPQKEMPERLYIISDMEFDCCRHADLTNFEAAKAAFEAAGYRLPQVIFWNVQSRRVQQPVRMNEQGAVLVSGCSPQVFAMIKDDALDPYRFMMSVLMSERYERISA